MAPIFTSFVSRTGKYFSILSSCTTLNVFLEQVYMDLPYSQIFTTSEEVEDTKLALQGFEKKSSIKKEILETVVIAFW